MKKLLITIFILLCTTIIYSNTVDSIKAKVVALNYYNFLKPGAKDLKVSKVNVKNYKGIITRYTFVFENINSLDNESIFSVKIETQDLKSGIYFCIMETETSREMIKIVKM